MFVFDTSHDPMHLQIVPTAFTLAEVEEHLDEVERYYTHGSLANAPVALLADVRAPLDVDARVRRRVAETFLKLSPVLSERAVGHAIVTNSAIVRGALTAILWIKEPSWKIQAFSDLREADAWLRSRFVAAGRNVTLPVPGWWAVSAARSGTRAVR